MQKQTIRHAHKTELYRTLKISGGSKNFEEGGAEDNLSAPSSFISNAHNEIYAFTRKKAAFWQKCEPIGGRPTAPFESATAENTEKMGKRNDKTVE